MNQNDIGALLKLITDKMRASADAELKEKGLTFSQSNVLNYLYDRGEEVGQKEIENFLGVSHPAVAGIVSRLEKNGFIYTYHDPNDKRNKIIGMSEKAKAISVEMQNDIVSREQSLVYSLSDKETEELRRMLISVYEHLDKYEAE
ncbi:MarR family winged helix-turn-helix transcriptional regulator [Breznakia pachnodae]|uniref:DNA-binding MarR family transcriptional regulator n=1 Tax=Breznakia pachnodae TaxID=265178 RepID=A0ABU0E2K2_9FIRM|nr:MarR family transcriptional regulator [Breznakia pachnodae]MDQ0360951.1 DNA-binding MarR family transcriptional regulator [Breznakia pachnodae]